MARAGYRTVVIDPAGRPLSGVVVNAYNTGTTTPYSGTIYAAATGGATLANPFAASAQGDVVFWLDAPTRVDLAYSRSGYTSETETVDVIAADAWVLNAEKGAASGVATLDATGVVPVAQIPGGAALDAEVTAAVAAHDADTTAVHGIADTSALALSSHAHAGIYVPTSAVKTYNALALPASLGLSNLTGDGVANDQPAFAALVSALGALYAADGIPRIIHCPGGIYSMRDAGTVWKSGVGLTGDGPGATRFVLSNPVSTTNPTPLAAYTADFHGASTSTPLVDCVFADFEVDGSAVTLALYSTGAKAFVLQYMVRPRFQNLYLHGCGATALGCDFLQDGIIDGVVAVGNGRLNSGSEAGGAGIGIGIGAWGASERTTIANCIAKGNGTHGIFVELQSSSFPRPRGIRVENCHAEGNVHGISDWGAEGMVVSGCHMIGNLKDGFNVSGSGVAGVAGRGGIVTGCVIDGNALDGVALGDTPGDYTISGNRVSNNGRHGIHQVNVTQAASYAGTAQTFHDNDVYGNALDGIRNDAVLTDGSITSNRLRNNGVQRAAADSGTGGPVTYGALTVTDTGKAWVVNSQVGKTVTVGAQTAVVASNTATVLTLWPYHANGATAWSAGTPAAGTAYSLPAAPTVRAGLTFNGAANHPTIRGNRMWDGQTPKTQTHGWWITPSGTCGSGTVENNDLLGNLSGGFQFDISPTGGYFSHNGGFVAGIVSSPSNTLVDGLLIAKGFSNSGLTGATAASRYVGATTSGPPVTGTFAIGDVVVDQAGAVWICTVAGAPGTWTNSTAALTASRPAAARAETMPRTQTLASLGMLLSGRLHLVAVQLPAGLPVASITFVAGATGAATPTNQWFALFNNAATPALLRQTADDTTAAWAANALKTLTLTSPFTTTYSGLHYLGIMVAATTVPTLMGVNGITAITATGPTLSGSSTAGLTTPASFTSPASAPTALSTGQIPYAYVS